MSGVNQVLRSPEITNGFVCAPSEEANNEDFSFKGC